MLSQGGAGMRRGEGREEAEEMRFWLVGKVVMTVEVELHWDRGVGEDAKDDEEVEEAEAGMPVTRSRLSSPLVKEETLKELRSVI